MLSIEERLRRADARVARQERQKRVQQRQEREVKRKAQQRRNYAVGELVLKYFPQLSEVESLDPFFALLSSDADLMNQIRGLLVMVIRDTERESPSQCSDV